MFSNKNYYSKNRGGKQQTSGTRPRLLQQCNDQRHIYVYTYVDQDMGASSCLKKIDCRLSRQTHFPNFQPEPFLKRPHFAYTVNLEFVGFAENRNFGQILYWLASPAQVHSAVFGPRTNKLKKEFGRALCCFFWEVKLMKYLLFQNNKFPI